MGDMYYVESRKISKGINDTDFSGQTYVQYLRQIFGKYDIQTSDFDNRIYIIIENDFLGQSLTSLYRELRRKVNSFKGFLIELKDEDDEFLTLTILD